MELKCGIYKHYKGRTFEVIGVGRHHETLEEFVLYKSLEDSEAFAAGTLWFRPVKHFFEAVIIDGKETTHFTYIGD